MPSEIKAPVSVTVQGDRIRAVRTQQQRTLDHVARQVGISKTFLSQIERGTGRPSSKVLYRIADALGVDLQYLLSTFEERPRARTYDELDFFRIRNSTALFAPLTRDLNARGLEVMLVRLPPSPTLGQLPVVTGEALLFVVSGKISLVLDQDAFDLHAGDSLHFRFTQSHGWLNQESSEALVLWAGVPRLV
ncbi:XRE family transcriptional regulator [Burkholderia sp. A1]|uniref:helix-turn-helix domain-containing protein n=1 Tax=Burkholderia sp. A1 TaxID=148446 RepID=UPI0004687EC1|nr:XRE family transcriptional regulator [Burkholderia sp. A1]